MSKQLQGRVFSTKHIITMPPRRKKVSATHGEAETLASIKYTAKRKNIPLAGLESQGRIQESPKFRYGYNPHLSPVLRSATDATGADKLPELLAKASAELCS